MKTYTDKNEILNEAKRLNGCVSDGDLCRLLDISRTRLSNYRNTDRNFNDDVSIKLDKLLKLPDGVISLSMHAIRSKCPQVSKVFHEISQKLAAGTLAIALCFSSLFAPSPAIAASESGQNVQILHSNHYAQLFNRIRRRRTRKKHSPERTIDNTVILI